MKFALIITAVCISMVKGNSLLHCYQSGTHYYEQIGCEPLYGKCESCPLRYKCEPKDPKPGYCRIAGKLYLNGEKVPNIGGCAGCWCSATEEQSSFTCRAVRCGGVKLEDGCRVRSNFDNICCSKEIACTGSCSARCLVDGIIYQDGERFRPTNTCKECICQSGFIGIYEEPFCRPVNCEIEKNFEERIREQPDLLYTCSPLYDIYDICCPVDFVCSVPNISGVPVVVDIAAKKTVLDRSSQCQLGTGFYNRGYKMSFVHENRNVQCECLIPPQFRCTYV